MTDRNRHTDTWLLENGSAVLSIEKTGGAISSFYLKENTVNPLSFVMERTEPGEYFKGHFLCAGRWGDPSPGEAKAGVRKHGDITNALWELSDDRFGSLAMQAVSHTEGLQVERTITLDSTASCFKAVESQININPLSRLCNMVQHPTLAAPFLDNDTIVDCNAGMGFCNTTENIDNINNIKYRSWPAADGGDRELTDLRCPQQPCTGVYSFTVENNSLYGWITAYSPACNLLIGYLWQRETYPWINHWLHWKEGQLLYRGLEFGTTGLHRSYEEIITANQVEILNEKTCFLLDVGERRTYTYMGFLVPVKTGWQGTASVFLSERGIEWEERTTGHCGHLSTTLNLQP